MVLTLLLGIGYAVQSSRDTTGVTATPPAGVVDDYAVPYGDETAPVTVTVYEDFMCPFCGDFEAATRDVLDELVASGDVRVEYRVLSFLDRVSNGTDYSTRAMSALGVVLDQAGPEAAVTFHDLFFENQPEEDTGGLSDDELVQLAVEAGADEADVRGPIEDRTFEQWGPERHRRRQQGRGHADPDRAGRRGDPRLQHDRGPGGRAAGRGGRGGLSRARCAEGDSHGNVGISPAEPGATCGSWGQLWGQDRASRRVHRDTPDRPRMADKHRGKPLWRQGKPG